MLTQKVYSPTNLFLSKAISCFLYPYYLFFNLFRKSYLLEGLDVKVILVTEYHRIGDVIMIAPALKAIKQKYPKSHLILLCNQQALELVRSLEMADEVISFQAPWTELPKISSRGCLAFFSSIFMWVKLISQSFKARSFAHLLRAKNIDLAIDFKGDIRNNWFLWHTNAKIRLGYTATGGSFFLSLPQRFDHTIHQTHRANNLVQYIGCTPSTNSPDNFINKNGTIVIHVGATDPRRGWPENHWLELIRLLSVNNLVTIIKTQESEGLIRKLNPTLNNVEVFQGSLVNFHSWLTKQQILIAPDSMAGHLAAYSGISVVSLFGSQNPKLTSPLGKQVSIVTPDLPCSHNRYHWRLCESCMESITPEKTFLKVTMLLSE